MLKRTGTKQRSDDRTTNLSRLIIIGNLRIGFFFCVTWWQKCVVGKPVNPKCGLRVECVGNRHDDNKNENLELLQKKLCYPNYSGW